MIVFKVEDMSCGHCVGRIEEAVKELDTNASIQIDLAAGTAQIKSIASIETLISAITEAGFPCRLAV